MKFRILTLLLALLMLFSFASCTQDPGPDAGTGSAEGTGEGQTPTATDVRVYTLNGTTGFGMAKLMDDAAKGAFSTENYTFDVKTDASEVLTALVSGDVDIAALPTNAASTVYNKTKGGVKILAINTLGCLFLLNTGDDAVTSLSGLSGKTVYCPAQNPTFIFTYLCQQNDLEVITDGTPGEGQVLIDSTSYAAPANLRDAVASGSVKLAVLPEPMVTIAVSKGKTATPAVDVKVALDLTAEWDKLPGKAGTLVQGCVVVRTAFLEEHPEAVANFLTAYEASIDYLNDNPAEAAALVQTYGIFENAAVAEKAIPKCNVRYIDGGEMKSAVGTYLEILSEVNANSIGGQVPEDDFYHIAQ